VGMIGMMIVPVLVTLTGLVYNVVVVVNKLTVVKLSVTLDTTSSVTGTDVEITAFVIVLIGMEPVPAGAENTDSVSLGGRDVAEPSGFSPLTMFTGPDCATTWEGFAALTHWKMMLFLTLSTDYSRGGGRCTLKGVWQKRRLGQRPQGLKINFYQEAKRVPFVTTMVMPPVVTLIAWKATSAGSVLLLAEID